MLAASSFPRPHWQQRVRQARNAGPRLGSRAGRPNWASSRWSARVPGAWGWSTIAAAPGAPHRGPPHHAASTTTPLSPPASLTLSEARPARDHPSDLIIVRTAFPHCLFYVGLQCSIPLVASHASSTTCPDSRRLACEPAPPCCFYFYFLLHVLHLLVLLYLHWWHRVLTMACWQTVPNKHPAWTAPRTARLSAWRRMEPR
jgi:hypothetical protein